MKDKFEIFTKIILKERDVNHYGIYITIGQFSKIFLQVNTIYDNWNNDKTLDENINEHFERSIAPMGDCGKNRL